MDETWGNLGYLCILGQTFRLPVHWRDFESSPTKKEILGVMQTVDTCVTNFAIVVRIYDFNEIT